MKAKFIKDLNGFTGTAKLWELNPPFKKRIKFVVTSATLVPFSGPETYVFQSDENGEVKKWTELSGSYRGGLDHGIAIRGLGYEAAV